MKDVISVIIPVYESEKYIEKCLQSVCKQTYQYLEIICVDDGSKDDSGRILDEMATIDKRIKVVHQKNNGESYARNVGLSLATGAWITFVDNDDWLDPDMYRQLIEAAHVYGSDIVCCSWFKESVDGSIRIVNKSDVAQKTFGRDEFLKYIYIRDEYQGFAYMWDKLYRRELFKEVRFDESLRVGGDVLALAEIALRARRVTYLDEAFYHYLQRSDSGCHTGNADILLDWVRAYDIVINLFQKAAIPPDIMRYVKRFSAYTASRAAKAALLAGDKISHEKSVNTMKRYQSEYEETNAEHLDWICAFRRTMEWRN